MTAPRLPAHLSYCLVGGEAIFLDLRSDSYFILDPGTRAAFDRLRGGRAASAADLECLRSGGLIEDGVSSAAIASPAMPAPATSLIEASAPARAGWADVLEVALRSAKAADQRRRGALYRAVGRLKEQKPAGPASLRRVTAAALSFAAARRWAPIPPNCLADSLALASYLSARGLSAHLVIGVKLDPFAAHCWVQADTIVLNDSLDSASGFTPILVV